MDFSFTAIQNIISMEKLVQVILFFFILVVIWIAFQLLHRMIMKYACKKCRLQTQQIISKGIRYTSYAIITFSLLNKLGINISAILGAAGIAGIAIGFAAQTTIANIISGLFLMSERSFESGDFITVDGISGTVTSIDIFSIKLQTPDNQLVRIPNETVIKSSVTNITHYPTRRLTFDIGVAYGSNLDEIRRQLIEVASQNSLTLHDPAPAVQIVGFGDSAVNMQLLTWTKKEYFLQYKTEIIATVHDTFKRTGIEIPFTHIDVSLVQ